MDVSLASPGTLANEEIWEEYPIISPNKFIVLCIFTLSLYGLWWQYKTWRFFKQWQRSDSWPVARTIFSLFTVHNLMETVNQFARHTNNSTPLKNTTGLATGYIIFNLLARLPDPLWLVSLGAIGFLVPAFRAFRETMLQAPAYGGREQKHFSARQLILLSVSMVLWALMIVGLTLAD